MKSFKSHQAIKVVQSPRAPREERHLLGLTGSVAEPPYSRLGYLRIHLDGERAPYGGPWLIHPENVKAL